MASGGAARVEPSVRVWWLRQAAQEEVIAAARDVLSDAEAERVASLRRAADRAAFTLRRAGLRHLLAVETGMLPGEVRIRLGARGVPLVERPHVPELSFSLAGRGEWALLALARGTDVGVDVERPADVPLRELAAHALPRDGRGSLPAASDADAWPIFLRSWTRIEALAKVDGSGLARTWRPGGRVALPQAHVRWIDAPGDYVAAVATVEPAALREMGELTLDPAVSAVR